MSNILKGYYVSVDEDSRVVDVEELIQKRIEEEAERKARLSFIMGNDESSNEDDSEGEADFTEGLFAESIDPSAYEEEYQNVNQENTEEINNINEELLLAKKELEELQAKAADIIENANAEAQRIQEEAYEEAKNRGYDEGYNAGVKEAEALKAELEAQFASNMQEYDSMVKNFEPQMVDIITDVYEKVFDICLDDYRNIVSSLVIDALNHSDGAKNIIIHLSKDDFLNISENKKTILMQTGMREDDVDFIQDATLSASECIIETENGVFDCSLSTELSELKRKLQLLSYKRE